MIFCLGFSATKVYLTRSQKADGAPLIASRWWQRLETIIIGYGLTPSFSPWEKWAKQLDQPQEFISLPPPAPCPPLSARPTTYSVTDIGLLLQDPYSIYGKHILKLRPLPPLQVDVSHKERGQLIHRALDLFYKNYKINIHVDPFSYLLKCGEIAFSPYNHHPLVKTFWWSRFIKIAKWVITYYHEEKDLIKETLSEQAGHFSFIVDDNLTVTLKTIADRIDLVSDGTLRLIDYKTGVIPSLKSVAQGYASQLPLEGLIFQALSLFDTPSLRVSQLSYWGLQGTGGGASGKIIDLRNPETLIAPNYRGFAPASESFQLGVNTLLSMPFYIPPF